MTAATQSLISITSILLCQAAQALTPITAHIDVEFDYQGGDEWRGQLFGGAANGDPGEGAVPSDTAFIVVPDIEWEAGPENEGAKFLRPAGSAWDFTGAEAGSPLWILTQSDNSIAWPGFENNHGESLVATYSSDDPRVSQTPRPWIRIQLSKVHYFGRGEGHFSLWQAGFGSQTVWASTAEGGITDEDAFFSLENGHDHANWGFSDLGVYVVDLYARAYLGSGMSNPTESAVMPVVFAVGSYAIWQATHFELADLLNPEISGDLADPDQDGVANMIEYALNTSPVFADRSPMEAGVGTQGAPALLIDGNKLAIEFVQRRSVTNPQIRYRAVFGSSLGEDSGWVESGASTVSPIDETWERVRVLDSVSLNFSKARFARLEVEWIDGD
ncbi:MAG: hypothetical protein ACR2RV_25850 [Verrucomicrobiales bacterium]